MFYNVPVKIYEEKDCVFNHRDEMAKLGGRALIVTGRSSSKKNGSLDDVINALADKKMEYVLFDEVEENPSVETVLKARDMGVAEKVDLVIGLGGGSPIDAAKAIAIMICYPECGGEFLYQKVDDVKHLPIVAIPTTCGTGSEATAVSVLTVHTKRTKASLPHRVFPELALVDAKYLKSAPAHIITATAVDAFAHMVESYINTGVSPYVEMFVASGLRTWGKSMEVLFGTRGAEDEDYSNFIHASTLAGMAIAHSGTTIPHSLSYNVTYEMGVAHGTAVGHFLPGYLRSASSRDREFILRNAGFFDMDNFEKFINTTCKVDKIPDEIIERSIQSVLANKAKCDMCPFEITYDVLKYIAG